MNSKTRKNFEEERELLLDTEEGFEKFRRISYPSFDTAVAKGVANNVGKWPSHLFAAFLAASLVFAAFFLFALVTAVFCVPTVSYRCRNSRNFEFAEFPNIYYIKSENRTWSRKELCYIESSARDNPEINVYIINLLTRSSTGNVSPVVKPAEIQEKREPLARMLILWEQANNSIDSSANATIETRIRKRLATLYANVRNVDVTIDDFFKGSMLALDSHKLDTKTLEIAAKAYLLWNISGVALSPLDSDRLGYLSEYLCKKECNIIKIASIDPEGSVLATGVPCQAFVGYLIHEIALNGIARGRNVVAEAQASFCKRLQECPGLKMINEDSHRSSRSLECPTIHPSEFSRKSSSKATHR